MKRAGKRVFSLIITLIMMVALVNPSYVHGADTTVSSLDIQQNQIVVLYTNDIHGGISDNSQYSGTSTSLGFAGLAAVKEQARKSAADVTLVDLGDALQGSVVGSESEGMDILDMMNQVGYDYQVMGNHEFDYGMEKALSFISNAKATYLGVNFIDLKSDKNITQPYAIKEYSVAGKSVKVAYIGVLTPENITKGDAGMFQDDDGNYTYSFYGEDTNKFYGAVQGAIDEAKSQGADYIIGAGHLGDEGITEGWSSREVIGNTEGFDVFLDGHAHSFLKGDVLKDKKGEDVLLSSSGTKLDNIGALRITVNEDGSLSSQTDLITSVTEDEKKLESYQAMDKYVQTIQDKYAHLMKKVGESDFGLYIYDPQDSQRLIRSQETNMGDFVTDAFRIGMNADVALSNGGNIRSDIQKGEITYLDVLNVLPWSDVVVKLEVTGQQLIDCLEMGARLWPEQCGGFIQTSGMTYDINKEVTPSVKVDENGMFVSVEGTYRVQNVKVAGKPLQLDKTYTLAIDDCYYSDIYDGMTMFQGSKAIVGPDAGPIDHDLVISYLEQMGGKVAKDYENVNGQGRIRLITNADNQITKPTPKPDETKKPAGTKQVKKGDGFKVKGIKYKVTKVAGKSAGTVTFAVPKSKKASSVTIPATVSYGGKKYHVTAIGGKAFANAGKLRKVTVGSHVTTIGSRAFYGCKKLKTIVIKSKKLTGKKVGSKAFAGIYKKAIVKVPKAKKIAYKKLLVKKGLSKKAQIK